MRHRQRTHRARPPYRSRTVLAAVVALGAALATTAAVLRAAGGQAAGQTTSSADPGDVVTGERHGLTVSAFATPYLGPGLVASVLLGVEALAQGAVPADAQVAASYSIQTGGTRSPARTVSVPVGRLGGGRAAPYLTELALPPGRHEILVSITYQAREGPALTVPVDVPSPLPPGSTGFSISPLALASNASPAAAAGDASDARGLLPILLRPPSPIRVYHAEEQVELFVEIYDWESEPGQERQFAVTTTVRDTAGATAFVLEELGLSEPLAGGRYGFAQSTLIPVHRLAPGAYTLDVHARSLTDPTAQASRVTRFAVRGATTPAAP